MSTTEIRSDDAPSNASAGKVDMKLEVVVIPVSDVDRAAEFYGRLGWRLDADIANGDSRRLQFTPPGLPVLDHLRHGRHPVRARHGSVSPPCRLRHPGGAQRAHRQRCRRERGLPRRWRRLQPLRRRRTASGPDPERRSYGSFVTFSDPEGNGWLLQEITTRFPSRIDSDATTFASATDLASAMRRASAAHGEHEKRTGQRDGNWPDWYAEYMVAEQAGTELPT